MKLKLKEKDYCVKAAFYNVMSKSCYHNKLGASIINTANNTNSKPCQCAYCRGQRQLRNLQLRKPLDNIERQLTESRLKREQLEITDKLLRLANRDRDKERSLG